MAYVKTVKSWSFSRLTDYDSSVGGCAYRFKLKHLDKLPEKKGEALERGSAIHEMAEKYIVGEGRKLPEELGRFADFFKTLRDARKSTPAFVLVEQMWGFTRDWKECAWDDWSNCWLRVKMDCAWAYTEDGRVIVDVDDWKTGKFRVEKNSEYMMQLELYALACLIRFAEFGDVEVRPRLTYLDAGVTFPAADDPRVVYTTKDLPRLKKTWEGRVKKMFADTVFKPEPSANACRFCNWKAALGGPCQF